MTIDLETMLQLLAKALPIALSFADDIFLFVLTKLGVSIPGLSWLSPVLLSISLLFYVIRWVMNDRKANAQSEICAN